MCVCVCVEMAYYTANVNQNRVFWSPYLSDFPGLTLCNKTFLTRVIPGLTLCSKTFLTCVIPGLTLCSKTLLARVIPSLTLCSKTLLARVIPGLTLCSVIPCLTLCSKTLLARVRYLEGTAIPLAGSKANNLFVCQRLRQSVRMTFLLLLFLFFNIFKTTVVVSEIFLTLLQTAETYCLLTRKTYNKTLVPFWGKFIWSQ